MCGSYRPASAHPGPPVNAAVAASSAGSSAPGKAASTASNSEQSSGSRKTKKVRENKLVRQREVQHFKLPLLANNAEEERDWLHAYLAYMRRFDATASGTFIWEWINKSFQIGLKQKHDEERGLRTPRCTLR